MAIDRFTKQQFEDALPKHKETGEPLWKSIGMLNKEECYSIEIDSKSMIMIRSSVNGNGLAAETGTDSIRAWLVRADGSPLGNKTQSHVTRVTGWAERMNKILRELWTRRNIAGDCPICGEPLSIFQVKKPGPNKGRFFVKCSDHNKFRWLDEPKPPGYDGKPKPKYVIPETDKVAEILSGLPTIKARVKSLRDIMEESKEFQIWGLLFVYDHQTAEEQAMQGTYVLNGVGFSGVDAEILSSFAEQWTKKERLSVKQFELLSKKMPKYAVQIEKLLRGGPDND